MLEPAGVPVRVAYVVVGEEDIMRVMAGAGAMSSFGADEHVSAVPPDDLALAAEDEAGIADATAEAMHPPGSIERRVGSTRQSFRGVDVPAFGAVGALVMRYVQDEPAAEDVRVHTNELSIHLPWADLALTGHAGRAWRLASRVLRHSDHAAPPSASAQRTQ